MGNAQQAPDGFLFGASISVYQNSGGSKTNWATFEDHTGCTGSPKMAEPVGISSDFWNMYETDIGLAAALNCRALRLSLEWSRIEPERGITDEAAIGRYHAMLDVMQRHNIMPILALHHFVHPQWFEDLGSFRKEQNIEHYVKFSQLAVRRFGERVTHWATFNEPNIMTFCGFLLGSHPPAKIMQPRKAGKALRNILRAHSAAYQAMKALPGGEKLQIGIIHNWMTFEPRKGSGPARLYLTPLTKLTTAAWANNIVVEYFRTGCFRWRSFIPGRSITFQEPEGAPGLDWFGVNYYSRAVVNWKCQPVCHPGEVMTDAPFPMYPEGIYQAVQYASQLGKPIYITETGIADAKDDRRATFVRGALDQVSDFRFSSRLPFEVQKALQDGYDVRTFLYWTLVDNFEWQEGFKSKYGLYQWSQGSHSRQLRAGGKVVGDEYAARAGTFDRLVQANAVRTTNHV